jgi:hypothetical protein
MTPIHDSKSSLSFAYSKLVRLRGACAWEQTKSIRGGLESEAPPTLGDRRRDNLRAATLKQQRTQEARLQCSVLE